MIVMRHGRRHRATYRQMERTFSVMMRAIGEKWPEMVDRVTDAMLEASIPERYKLASASVAIDWTDYESFSRPKGTDGGPPADKEAILRAAPLERTGRERRDLLRLLRPGRHDGPRGRRRGHPRARAADRAHRLFGRPARRHGGGAHPHGRRWDPTLRRARRLRLLVRKPETFALAAPGARRFARHGPAPGRPGREGNPCRRGDLQREPLLPVHPHAAVLALPSPRGASEADQQRLDAASAELSRYKLGVSSGEDTDGHLRVSCPAVLGKIRCPLRPSSLSLSFERPSVAAPPTGELPACCRQRTVTVPPSVAAKTRQRHDYPSAAHRRSYGRRTASERSFASGKDPAGIGDEARMVPAHGKGQEQADVRARASWRATWPSSTPSSATSRTKSDEQPQGCRRGLADGEGRH